MIRCITLASFFNLVDHVHIVWYGCFCNVYYVYFMLIDIISNNLYL